MIKALAIGYCFSYKKSPLLTDGHSTFNALDNISILPYSEYRRDYL